MQSLQKIKRQGKNLSAFAERKCCTEILPTARKKWKRQVLGSRARQSESSRGIPILDLKITRNCRILLSIENGPNHASGSDLSWASESLRLSCGTPADDPSRSESDSPKQWQPGSLRSSVQSEYGTVERRRHGGTGTEPEVRVRSSAAARRVPNLEKRPPGQVRITPDIPV